LHALAIIAVVVLAYGGPEVAKVGAALLCLVYAGLVVVGLVESRPEPPCTTHALPPMM
jgi:hypothetical protein